MKKFVRKLSSLPVYEILLLVIGLLLVVFPGTATQVVLRVIGVLVLVYAVYRVAFLLACYVRDAGFTFLLICELLLATCGVILIVNPVGALAFLTSAAGLYLLIDCGVQLYRAVMWSGRNVLGILFPAVGIVFGLFLLLYPTNAANISAILCGIALLLEGAERLILRLLHRAAKPKVSLKSEYIEAEFEDKSDEL